jgi:trehalose/maltose hydrolase-like predicted phosphorylase
MLTVLIGMTPSILLLHPRIASSLIHYRVLRIPAAQQKAQSFGYKGALYPWESAFTGAETCPNWAPEGKLEQRTSTLIRLHIINLTRY